MKIKREEKVIRPKKVKGRITVLMAAPYKGSMMYIRKIGEEIYEYLTIYNDQLYSNYMIFTLPKGKKKMSKAQVIAARNLLIAGGQSTIDALLGDTIENKDKKLVEDFEQITKALPKKEN